MTEIDIVDRVDNPDDIESVLERIVTILTCQIEEVQMERYDRFDRLCLEVKVLADRVVDFEDGGDTEVSSLLEKIQHLRTQLSLTLAAQYHEAGASLQKLGQGKAILRAYK